MVGWDKRLNGNEFEQTLGDGEGQGSLVCRSPWGGALKAGNKCLLKGGIVIPTSTVFNPTAETAVARHELATEQQQSFSRAHTVF